jgi:hypothetical protein
MKIKKYTLIIVIFLFLSGGILYKQTGIFCNLSEQPAKSKIEITEKEIIFKNEKIIKYINRNNAKVIEGNREADRKLLYDELILMPDDKGILICHVDLGYEWVNSFLCDSYNENGEKIGSFEPYQHLDISPDAKYVVSYDSRGYTLKTLSFLGKVKVYTIEGKLIKEIKFKELEGKSGLNKIEFTSDGNHFVLGFIIPDEAGRTDDGSYVYKTKVSYYIFNCKGELIKEFSLKPQKLFSVTELENIELNFKLILNDKKLILFTRESQLGYDEIKFIAPIQ